jgi:hypothetical protein
MALLGLVCSVSFFSFAAALPFLPSPKLFTLFLTQGGRTKRKKGGHKTSFRAWERFPTNSRKGIAAFDISSLPLLPVFLGGLCFFYLDRGDLVGLFILPFDLFLAAFSIGLGDWLVALLCSRPFYTLQNVHSVAHNNKNGSFSFILENYITLHHTFYTLYAYLR